MHTGSLDCEDLNLEHYDDDIDDEEGTNFDDVADRVAGNKVPQRLAKPNVFTSNILSLCYTSSTRASIKRRNIGGI